MSTQPLAGVDPASRNPRRDATSSEGTAEDRGVVRFVAVQFVRTLPRTTWLAPRADDRGNRVDEREQLGCIVGVGRREPYGQGDAIPIHHEVKLRPRLATVRRVRAGRFAPLFARTLRLSTLARDQSRTASSPNQFSSVSCSRSQTLAACQSRSRRQHVAALPHPNSLGRDTSRSSWTFLVEIDLPLADVDLAAGDDQGLELAPVLAERLQ